ncbi:MAG: LamG-like jellyroll fold domain-containing protein [Bacteroidota bacterium]
MNKWIKTGLLAAVPALLLMLPACKKYKDIPPYFENNTDTLKKTSRKVLIIGIDGAVGAEYKTIQPPVLVGMQTHSKFSYEAVSDEGTSDAASWKSLVSGISFSRHKIQDSSFIYTQPLGSAPHDAPAIYPSIFTYLLSSSKSDTRTSLISSWSTLNNRLVPEVEDKVLAANDAAVKDSAIVRLKNPKSDLVIVHFNGAAIAGRASSFSASAAAYKDAVLKVDGYIGELMTALKARPDYNKQEEWLVIVNGTHGGTGNTYGGPSDKETNVISFYYNERMKQKELIRGGAFSGIQVKNRDAAAIKAQIADDGGLYNPGTGQQTIQLSVKGTSGAYPHFFSKMAVWPSTPGWSMFTSGQTWAISVRSTTGGESRIQGTTPNVFDNKWHTITVVFADSASKKWLRRYTDGVRTDQTEITTQYNNSGTFTNTSQLLIGHGADPGQGFSTIYTADISIFNTALTDAEIAGNKCNTNLTTHPKYANLIGYWPANDGYGGRLKNQAPAGAGKDFVLRGGFTWDGQTEVPCTTIPNTSTTKVSQLLKSVDVAATMFYWLKITPAASWGLEGSTWLSQYEIEFITL